MVNGYVAYSLADALKKRAEEAIIPYGGGTDLMVEEEKGRNFLFLSKVPELKIVEVQGDYLKLGSANTFTELIENEKVPQILKDAMSQIAAPAIRNAGTIGGNIGNGSSKADSALVFWATDSLLKIASVRGERMIPINEFYKGRKELDLADDEIIVEVHIPSKGIDNYYFEKTGARNALAISRVSFAGIMDIQDGVIKHTATAFGAVTPAVVRPKEADDILIGKTIDEAKALKEDYLKAIDESIQPTRGRISAEYRKDVCLNMVRAFLDKFGI
jgi:Aerobic-type carbon monoxide dehydrogenase, middle subunit CoxM/CutM homologs